MTMNPLCSICLRGEEDSLHVLKDCRFAQEVWSKSCRDSSWMLADQDNLQPWLLKNLSNSNRSPPGWNYRFSITLDLLWHRRNRAIFQGQSITTNQVVAEINAQMIFATTYGLNQQSQVGEVNYSYRLNWMKPPKGILKLNCDGAVFRENMASCGGVIRDSYGRFVVAFTEKLGMCSILKSKLWAIIHGLRILVNRNLGHQVIIESDSSIAVRFVNEGCFGSHPYFTLVQEIKELSNQFSLFSCYHILREDNLVADILAKRMMVLEKDFFVYESHLSFSYHLLLADNSVFLLI
uniref:Ribonuclease H protein At1g65750 family n=1 Tax=Cajanus cajan TaxID=3821 RepID=A0A151TIJ6_CAJCA|nr:Putative ribonuclease H protein At1g65750 family [Cajanus cajan]